jgi:hypothetical protein
MREQQEADFDDAFDDESIDEKPNPKKMTYHEKTELELKAECERKERKQRQRKNLKVTLRLLIGKELQQTKRRQLGLIWRRKNQLKTLLTFATSFEKYRWMETRVHDSDLPWQRSSSEARQRSCRRQHPRVCLRSRLVSHHLQHKSSLKNQIRQTSQ